MDSVLVSHDIPEVSAALANLYRVFTATGVNMYIDGLAITDRIVQTTGQLNGIVIYIDGKTQIDFLASVRFAHLLILTTLQELEKTHGPVVFVSPNPKIRDHVKWAATEYAPKGIIVNAVLTEEPQAAIPTILKVLKPVEIYFQTGQTF
jgi:hypothetical protein